MNTGWKPTLAGSGKRLARRLLRHLPLSVARLEGKAAVAGGEPIRNLRFRPWTTAPQPSLVEWVQNLEPALRAVFLSGVEGLPQPQAKAFATTWAKYCGATHGLLVPHGTDALRIALAAALKHDGLGDGGEVIVPNLTFIASANAALDRHFSVCLADVSPETLTLDPASVAAAIVPGRTRAILAVHLFGLPADMDALRALATQHGLALIEDAAQAHGAVHRLGPCGSIGDAAAFSFQSSKNLSAGEGGALTTSDPDIFERAYQLHNVGRPSIGAQRWSHESIGFNIRSSEYTAAVLSSRFPAFLVEQSRRERSFAQLHQILKTIDYLHPLSVPEYAITHGMHMFAFRYEAEGCGGLGIDDFVNAIVAEGIPIGRAYPSTVGHQPAVRDLMQARPGAIRALPTPVADAAVRDLLFLPHHVLLGDEDEIAEVGAAFIKVQRHFGGVAVALHRRPVSTVPVPAPRPTTKAERLVRVGLIGCGIQGEAHARAIAGNPRFSLVAAVDPVAGRAEKMAGRTFPTPSELIGSGAVDVIVVATPHPAHAAAVIEGLRHGLHVMCEKPVTVGVVEADAIREAARGATGLFAAVHQSRFDPRFRAIHDLLHNGELGRLLSCSMVEQSWRSQAYYAESPWRGTWKGEGGGVLLNQAPHVLDRYLWFCGVPRSVLATTATVLHDIETEDAASALFIHADGGRGSIQVDTVGAPALSTASFTCEGGRVDFDGDVRVARLSHSLSDARGEPTSSVIHLRARGNEFDEQMSAFYADFFAALGGAPLTSPGIDGLAAVELANAVQLSASVGRKMDLPIGRDEYATFLADKMQQGPRAT